MRIPISRLLCCAALVSALAATLAWFASTEAGEYISRTGFVYTNDAVDTVWALADSSAGDSLDVVRTSVIVHAVGDTLITEALLDSAGFLTTDVLCDSLPGNYYVLSVPDTASAFAHLDSLETWDVIDWARFPLAGQRFLTTNDTYFGSAWHLADPVLRLQSAWAVRRDINIPVYVPDSGVFAQHEDLYDIAGGSATLQPWDEDDEGHGTAVVSMLAAVRNNAKGIAGIVGTWNAGTPKNVFVVQNSPFDESSLLATFNFLLYRLSQSNEVPIVNLSAGIAAREADISPPLREALSQLLKQDVLIVCAGGQGLMPREGGRITFPRLAWPASNDSTLAVRGYNKDTSTMGYVPIDSNSRGADVLAPSDSLRVAGHQGSTQYTYQAGTSVAAPIVTGIAALVRSEAPELNMFEVRDIIRQSATKIDSLDGQYYAKEYGYGLVNALGAIVGARYNAQLIEGTVDTSVTLPDSRTPFTNLYFGADFGIASGATVTIRPGTTVHVGKGDYTKSGADTARVEFVVDGTLVIGDPDSAAVVFDPVDIGENAWYGIKVNSGGVLQLSNATISGATYGVRHEGTATSSIEDCTFTNNSTRDLRIGAASDSCRMRVEGCTFTVDAGTGIELINNVNGVTLTGNTLTGSSSSTAGIQVGSGTSGKTPLIENCTFSGFTNGSAILHANSSATILDCTFTSGKYGIEVTSGSPTIGSTASGFPHNSISGQTHGIRCVGSTATPTVRMCSITSNSIGVIARTSAVPNLGDAYGNGNNDLHGNSSYCVQNTSSGVSVPAIGNYFGVQDSSCTPTPCTNGNVLATDWVCDPDSLSSLRQGGHRIVESPASEAKALRITGVYPNPMVSAGDIQFTAVAGQAEVHARIFDVTGRIVRDLGTVTAAEGMNRMRWDGRDSRGTSVGTGLYFVRLSTERGLMSSARVFVVR